MCLAVTAEEDDLWSTLPEAVLANQNEQLQYLQDKLTAMRAQMGELGKRGPQLVFVSTLWSVSNHSCGLHS